MTLYISIGRCIFPAGVKKRKNVCIREISKDVIESSRIRVVQCSVKIVV